MEKTKESRCRKRRQGAGGEEKPSSSSKVARNENTIEGTMELARMSEDASVLFSHFPEEIWLLITDKLVDSETLTNLMLASPVFRNLLLPRRVEFLFPQVFQVLGLKIENEEIFIAEGPRYRVRGPKILTLRDVCKIWCQGVDEFYGDLPEHYTMQGVMDLEEEDKPSFMRVGDWMRDEEINGWEGTAEKFMEKFDQTHYFEGGNHRNPIINRKISISYEYGDRQSGNFNLLEKYGHHFWHCELQISDDFPAWITFYTELKELLQLLPNLKTLNLVYREFANSEIFSLHEVQSEMDIHQLVREIASHPLPKLNKLQFLSLRDFPSWIFNPVVSAYNHISMLEVLRDEVEDGYDLYSFPMPNLKQLSIKYFSTAEFENLNKLEVNWSLEKIYLNLRPCPFIPWSQIFSLLEAKWADTLINVAIFTPSTTRGSAECINIIDDGSSTTLNLPKVERFLFSTQEISSLDFILPMKSLKVLLVGLRTEIQLKDALVKPLRVIQKNQVVQFVGYFQRFHTSNIWSLFPNLKSLKLGNADSVYNTYFRVLCTRKDYDKSAIGRIENLWPKD